MPARMLDPLPIPDAEARAWAAGIYEGEGHIAVSKV